MKMFCPVDGEKINVPPIKGTMRYDRAAMVCPTHGSRLEDSMQRKAKEARSGGGVRTEAETPAHRIARLEFNRLVTEWPCWARKHRPCGSCAGRRFDTRTGEVCPFCDGDGKHHCRGLKDAHHLCPKSWIEEHFAFLPEDELLAIKFAPIIGAPACRYGFHEPLENRSEIIYADELDPELIEFCEAIDAKYADRSPKPPSMLLRLEVESPPRPAKAAA